MRRPRRPRRCPFALRDHVPPPATGGEPLLTSFTPSLAGPLLVYLLWTAACVKGTFGPHFGGQGEGEEREIEQDCVEPKSGRERTRENKCCGREISRGGGRKR